MAANRTESKVGNPNRVASLDYTRQFMQCMQCLHDEIMHGGAILDNKFNVSLNLNATTPTRGCRAQAAVQIIQRNLQFVTLDIRAQFSTACLTSNS